jgi:hypothetical protein
MWHLSTVQNKPITIEPSLYSNSRSEHNQTICLMLNGLNHRPPTSERIWYYSGHGGPRPFKGVILCPCVKTITWEGTGILLQDNLFKRFGLPDKMISNRDPRFAAHTFQELLKLLNIELNLTTAYHLQSDRATKRVNVTILPLGHMASRTRAIFYFHFLHVLPSVSSFVSYVISPPFCIHKSVSFNNVFLSPLPSVTCMILIHVSLIFITELEYINTSRTTFIPQSTLCKWLLVIQSFFLRFTCKPLGNRH